MSWDYVLLLAVVTMIGWEFWAPKIQRNMLLASAEAWASSQRYQPPADLCPYPGYQHILFLSDRSSADQLAETSRRIVRHWQEQFPDFRINAEYNIPQRRTSSAGFDGSIIMTFHPVSATE